ncbi:5'-3' exoribonuclease 2 [Acropora cervicornis]|uniref:5'-3' exoribonuclease n=1 Tax=Acropora cervicornis TaxID=6130 RepID=A0AAD9QG87_ACRCE|nr:5'-3' exoribonuclease 2 [Acropora cervicornis]
MGVPAFFRWLSKKYPSIVVHCVEEKLTATDGIKHYVFLCVYRIFSIVRPRKLLYMAIDGVAPRAKMNQQRSRRFRASKESKEKAEEIARIRSELKEKGAALPEVKEKTEHFDSNCITPGTEFMANLSLCLRYYIADRLNNDPGWKNIQVILSDANVPGEGEHKIMDYIRKQRGNPNHDPNTRHCLNGADADLIMLGLATHELNFTIIREEFKPNQKRPCEICGQLGHAMDECMGLPKEKLGEFDELSTPVAQDVEFIFIRLNVLREYLERELRMEGLPFPYSFERSLDDWVFMCFFVGNDFLPHLPSLEIRENAIDRLVAIYKRVLPRCGGYLAKHGIVDLGRVQMILQELGYVEDEIFKKRQQNDLAYKRRLKENKARDKLKRQRMDTPLWTPSGQYHPNAITSTPRPIASPRQEAYAMRKQAMSYSAGAITAQNDANKNAAANLRAMLIAPSRDQSGASDTSAPNSVPTTSKRKLDEDSDEEEPKDEIRLWEAGWKGRYYKNKFQLSESDVGYDEFRKEVADAYVEGLCWVLLYYYQFKPLEQLMGVFPAASGNFIPPTWRNLMSNPESPIIDFYPQDFQIDLNGKKYAWQGVALLPFVDEKRLLSALSEVYSDLTESEKIRNSRGKDRLFLRQGNPVFDFLVGLYEGNIQGPVDVIASLSGGITVRSPLPNLYDLEDNRAIRPPARVLKPEGFDKNTPYRPVIGMNANRTSFAQISDAGRRMLNFHRGDFFRPHTPASYVPLFRSFSGPPQNNPRHSNPAYPRSNPSTPLSSRDYGEARRPAYDRRRAPQHSHSDGYEGYRSQYNSGRFQGNGPSASSYSTYSPGGSGSYQSQYSRGSHQFSPRDQSQRQQQRQQPHRNQGPPTRQGGSLALWKNQKMIAATPIRFPIIATDRTKLEDRSIVIPPQFSFHTSFPRSSVFRFGEQRLIHVARMNLITITNVLIKLSFRFKCVK